MYSGRVEYCEPLTQSQLAHTNGMPGACGVAIPVDSSCSITCPTGYRLVDLPYNCISISGIPKLSGHQHCRPENARTTDGATDLHRRRGNNNTMSSNVTIVCMITKISLSIACCYSLLDSLG